MFDERFAPALVQALSGLPEGRLSTAMRYALNGGKRLRAQLVYATGAVLDTPSPVYLAALDAAAVAIELIHAYSLVHDDLPAMDNDDLRRGQPTVHKAFDEATAILVGDALQSLAFEVLSHSGAAPGFCLHQIQVLSKAASAMCGGQMLDMQAEQQQLALPDLQQLHWLKTGALIHASFALAGELPPNLDRAARLLGLAYQIQDDILDATQSTDTLGKTAGKDAQAQKSTFVSVLGLAVAQQHCTALFAECLDLLEGAPALHALVGKIGGRGF
jgi:farnesyl diphosphate synthase